VQSNRNAPILNQNVAPKQSHILEDC